MSSLPIFLPHSSSIWVHHIISVSVTSFGETIDRMSRFMELRPTLMSSFFSAINMEQGSVVTNRVSQEERTKLREGVPYVKLYRYNPKHLCPKLNGFRDNGKWSLKLCQLLHTCWLPNSYWNWQAYVVSVMLISVLNIKVTCEWHKPLNWTTNTLALLSHLP